MIRLAIRCHPSMAEQVLAELVELAPGGVEEGEGIDPCGRAYVEYAIYGPPGEVPELPDLEAAAGDGLIEVRTTRVEDDWAERWRQFHKPIEIDGRIRVRPPWEPASATPAESGAAGANPGGAANPGGGANVGDASNPGDAANPDGPAPELIEIVIDPGQAFGTGSHATTSMCLRLLIGLADEGAEGPVTDLGTGSGVLAIAAVKLGLEPVLGCDHAAESIEAAAENARVNGVELQLEQINLRERPAPGAPIWLANLTAPLLLEVVARMGDVAELPEHLILSGMLTEEAVVVADALAPLGYLPQHRLDLGDWAAMRLRAT